MVDIRLEDKKAVGANVRRSAESTGIHEFSVDWGEPFQKGYWR
ncbi:MAG: hypothetical protein PVI06_12240 [Desulfobacterales bacterium]